MLVLLAFMLILIFACRLLVVISRSKTQLLHSARLTTYTCFLSSLGVNLCISSRHSFFS